MTSHAHGDSPPRVLLLVDDLRRTGASRITIELARRWAGDGGRLAALQWSPQALTLTPPTEVAFERLASHPGRVRRTLPGALRRLIAASRDVDVILAGSEIGLAFVVGFFVARATRTPYVVAVHADIDQAIQEWMPRRLHGLVYWVHRHVDGAICVSADLAPPLERNGLRPDRIRVVRNGIDIDAITQAATSAESLIRGDERVLVATGRLAPQKATDLLIQAHARLVRELPHELLILNNGPELEALLELAATLHVSDSVRIITTVDNPLPTVAEAYAFCLPSRHEGLPLALLEAIALGVPTIAADCSEGVHEALDGGRVGELLPVDDVDALTDALARHLRNPEALRLRATRGPAHARSFDVSVMAAEWAAALRAFINLRAGHSQLRPAAPPTSTLV